MAALAVTLVTGCKTASVITPASATAGPVTNTVTTFLGQQVTPAGLYSQFRGGTAQAAVIALRSDPNALPYLQAVQQVLNATVTSGAYDPTTLSNALAQLPIKQIHNPAALEAIQSGFAMFEIIAPLLQNGVNGQNPFIIPSLQGIADGIGDALSLVQPPATTGTAIPLGSTSTATQVPASAAAPPKPANPATNAPPTADAGK
jgi:hypothetical protein